MIRILRMLPPLLDVAVAAVGLRQVASSRAAAEAEDEALRHMTDRLGRLEQRLSRLETDAASHAAELGLVTRRLYRLIVVVGAVGTITGLALVLVLIALARG